MTNEIFYLESCLAIEKSMAEIEESFAEATQSIDEGFLFESPKNVFESIKQKILAFIEKIKSIFKGKAAKAQTNKIAKAGKAKKGKKIKCADSGKIVGLFNKAKAMIAKGKDSEQVCTWFKRGCIALGVLAAGGAAVAGVKYAKGKPINAENAGAEAAKIDNAAVKEGENTKKQAFSFLSKFKKSVEAGKSTQDGEKAKGLLKLGSIFSSAMCGAKRSIVSGLAAVKNAPSKMKNARRNSKNSKNMRAAYGTGDSGDGADGFNESSDDIFADDDLMLADESADDLMLAQESYEDIFGEDVHDIFADDDLMLADESADDYSDIFGDIDDEEAGC